MWAQWGLTAVVSGTSFSSFPGGIGRLQKSGRCHRALSMGLVTHARREVQHL